MRTMIIARGLPGSGKSTWAKALLKKEPNRWKRINRDDLRNMLDDGQWSVDREEFIREVQNSLIRTAMKEGFDVIVDNTSLVPQAVKKLHRLAEGVGDVKVMEKCFNESVETCLERNSKREGRARVPDKTIVDMAHGAGIDRGKKLVDREDYYPPKFIADPIVNDPTLPDAVICDLDGTLALMGDRSPYDASQCDIIDKPNWPVIRTVLAFHAQGAKVLFTSGRDAQYREPTIRFIEKWCQKQEFPMAASDNSELVSVVIPYELFMRATGDMRKDAIVKQELFDENIRGKYNVLFALDDRNQVVDFWRSIGLACFQVNPGDF